MMTQTAVETKRRKELLKNENKVFTLNEGCCPDCFHDVEIINIGGHQGFMEAWEHLDCVKSYWAIHPDHDTHIVGGIDFKCQNPKCAHKHYIEQSDCGDWLI